MINMSLKIYSSFQIYLLIRVKLHLMFAKIFHFALYGKFSSSFFSPNALLNKERVLNLYSENLSKSRLMIITYRGYVEFYTNLLCTFSDKIAVRRDSKQQFGF